MQPSRFEVAGQDGITLVAGDRNDIFTEAVLGFLDNLGQPAEGNTHA